MIDHQDEIFSRPKKEWYQSKYQKEELKENQREDYIQNESVYSHEKEGRGEEGENEEGEEGEEGGRNRRNNKRKNNPREEYDQEWLKKKKLEQIMGKKVNKESGLSRKKRRALKIQEEEDVDEHDNFETQKLVERSIRQAKKGKPVQDLDNNKAKSVKPKTKYDLSRDQYLENTYFPENNPDPLRSIKSIFDSEMSRASHKVQKAQDSVKLAKKASKKLEKEDEVERKKLEEFDPSKFRKRRSGKKGVKKFKSKSKFKRKK